MGYGGDRMIDWGILYIGIGVGILMGLIIGELLG